MTIQPVGESDFLLTLNREELVLLNNALNEVCNGIDTWEFSSRLGSDRDAALQIMNQIGKALGA